MLIQEVRLVVGGLKVGLSIVLLTHGVHLVVGELTRCTNRRGISAFEQ